MTNKDELKPAADAPPLNLEGTEGLEPAADAPDINILLDSFGAPTTQIAPHSVSTSSGKAHHLPSQFFTAYCVGDSGFTGLGKELVCEVFSPSEGTVCLGISAAGMQDKRDEPVDNRIVKRGVEWLVKRFSYVFDNEFDATKVPRQLPDVISIKTSLSQDVIQRRMAVFAHDVETCGLNMPVVGDWIDRHEAKKLVAGQATVSY